MKYIDCNSNINILFNYNFNIYSENGIKTVSGPDQRNLWAEILIKKLQSINANIYFKNQLNEIQGECDIEIHINNDIPIYLGSYKIGLFIENPIICGENNNQNAAKYHSIITFNKKIKKPPRIIYSNYPCFDITCLERLQLPFQKDMSKNSFSMVANNKYIKNKIKMHYTDLYSKRREVVRYFESLSSNEFNLYGSGWDAPTWALGSRAITKKFNKLNKFYNKKFLKSFKGSVALKSSVLTMSTFNFCYENIAYPNYITEKYFDAILSDCVPIYYGWHDQLQIPPESFIDASQFKSIEELVSHCKNLNLKDREKIIKNGQDFLKDNKEKFSHQEYARKIYQEVVYFIMLKQEKNYGNS